MVHFLRLISILAVISSVGPVFAQDDDDGGTDSAAQEIESLYDKSDSEPSTARKARPKAPEKEKEVETLTDLATLSPFEDVAVIQRRFLPKTGRFELSPILFSNLNNPFFNSFGAGARAAYYIREKYAIEGIATFTTTSSRQVTDDLEKKRGITTDNVVTSKGFYGVSLKWNPIYGKITWLNRSIVPFDLNFNLGFGMTRTDENSSEPTLHLGTSQIFAWSKSMAFRWDLIWNMYSATATSDNGSKEKLNQNDLFLGIGMSFYFPEASYR
ncbi:MAG: outer membrane beta-barrel domain-containing protein [Bdellovibrionales bacterium]